MGHRKRPRLGSHVDSDAVLAGGPHPDDPERIASSRPIRQPRDLAVLCHKGPVGAGYRLVWSTREPRRLPNSELVIYPGAGHAGIFQNHREFVETALQFLDREQKSTERAGGL